MSSTGVAVILVDAFSKRILLLHRTLNWTGWEYVKGHLNHGEELEDAARRETEEETGLTVSSLHRLNAPLIFNDGMGDRDYTTFLGVANSLEVTPSLEHDDARWVPVSEARTLLTFPDQLPPLEAAETLINTLL